MANSVMATETLIDPSWYVDMLIVEHTMRDPLFVKPIGSVWLLVNLKINKTGPTITSSLLLQTNVVVTKSILHKRLYHPSSQTLDKIIKSCKLKLSSNIQQSIF